MTARRWVTAEGARIDLAHLTGTRGALDARLRDGGTLDGWQLTVRHPGGAIASVTYLGADVPEASLAAALAAVGAVRALPTTPERNTR